MRGAGSPLETITDVHDCPAPGLHQPQPRPDPHLRPEAGHTPLLRHLLSLRKPRGQNPGLDRAAVSENITIRKSENITKVEAQNSLYQRIS